MRDEQTMNFGWSGGTVSGTRNGPEHAEATLLLAHGAGRDATDPLLAGIAVLLAAEGIAVVRFNFPYKEAGRKAPDPPARAQSCLRAVADAVAGVGALYLGGKSFGGRMASHVVADGYPAAGLVLLSYPLHPPGRPERLRDEHLPRIGVPTLVCQGTSDPFSKEELLRRALGRMDDVTLHAVEGGNHDLAVRDRFREEILDEVAAAIVGFVRRGRPSFGGAGAGE